MKEYKLQDILDYDLKKKLVQRFGKKRIDREVLLHSSDWYKKPLTRKLVGRYTHNPLKKQLYTRLTKMLADTTRRQKTRKITDKQMQEYALKLSRRFSDVDYILPNNVLEKLRKYVEKDMERRGESLNTRVYNARVKCVLLYFTAKLGYDLLGMKDGLDFNKVYHEEFKKAAKGYFTEISHGSPISWIEKKINLLVEKVSDNFLNDEEVEGEY